MPAIEFVGQSRQDSDNKGSNTARLLNCYREPIGDGKYALKSVLSTSAFATIPAVFMRAMKEIGGAIYAGVGGGLYKVTSGAIVTSLGSIVDAEETTIADNNGDVCVAAGGSYYVYTGGTLTTPTLGAFSAAGSIVTIAQRTVVTEKDGRRFQWSGVADASTFGGLDFATAEAQEDNCLRALNIDGILWLLKERSIERWYPTATGFDPITGGTIDRGLKSYGLVAPIPSGAFFVGNDDKAYLLSSAGPQPVSAPAVETAISQGTPTEALYYRDEGHEFCVIRFDDRPAWVFDLSTGEWHERAEGGDFGAWSARACVEAFGAFYVGGWTGAVQKLTRGNADVSEALVRRAVGRTFRMAGDRFKVKRLGFTGNVGRADIGRTAQIMLRVSSDRGATWGDPRNLSFGALGDYDLQVNARALGQFRSFTPEVSWSDPADMNIDAEAEIEVA